MAATGTKIYANRSKKGYDDMMALVSALYIYPLTQPGAT